MRIYVSQSLVTELIYKRQQYSGYVHNEVIRSFAEKYIIENYRDSNNPAIDDVTDKKNPR